MRIIISFILFVQSPSLKLINFLDQGDGVGKMRAEEIKSVARQADLVKKRHIGKVLFLYFFFLFALYFPAAK